MDEPKLINALFELADTWCQNINEYEYKEFFEQLDHRLQFPGQQDNSAYDVMP